MEFLKAPGVGSCIGRALAEGGLVPSFSLGGGARADIHCSDVCRLGPHEDLTLGAEGFQP